jgi:hypothetical protein
MSKLSDDANQTCAALAGFINSQGEQLLAKGYSNDETFAILATALTHCSASTLSQRSKGTAAGIAGFMIAVSVFAKQMMDCGNEIFRPAPTDPDGRPLQ